MNAKPYDDLPSEVSEKIADAFRVPKTAAVAKKVIEDRLKELAETGELQRLSDEECQVIAELRRFKATHKSGAVFKWQTRHDGSIVVPADLGVELADVSLISHPQNVSD